MIKCLQCGSETENPKFCSQSCSASYNNKGICRNGQNHGNCIRCNKSLDWTRTKYCSNKCKFKYQWEERKRTYKEENWIDQPLQRRKYLLERDGNRCEICGRVKWNKQNIPLVADHIDGNPENHKIDNLRLICCNCDALLPTYKARNKGNGRKYRRNIPLR